MRLSKDGNVIKTATTGSAGGCNITKVEADDYVLTATMEGYDEYTRNYTVSKSETVNIILSRG